MAVCHGHASRASTRGNYLSSSSALLRSCSRQSQDPEHRACDNRDSQTTAGAAEPSERTSKPILLFRCELHGFGPLDVAGARHARDFGRNFGDCTLNPKPKTLNPKAQKAWILVWSLGFMSRPLGALELREPRRHHGIVYSPCFASSATLTG